MKNEANFLRDIADQAELAIRLIDDKRLDGLKEALDAYGDWLVALLPDDEDTGMYECLFAERTVLRKALKEACDEFEDASQYKGEYMRKKHGDDETLARLRALLPAK